MTEPTDEACRALWVLARARIKMEREFICKVELALSAVDSDWLKRKIKPECDAAWERLGEALRVRDENAIVCLKINAGIPTAKETKPE